MVQEALDRWWGPLMQMHGPPTDPAKDKDLHWGIKAKNNEQLRQEFLSIYVPRIRELGLRIPDPALRYDEAERSLALHRAGLGRAEVGRHRPRPGIAVAPRVPPRPLRRHAVGARRPPRERDRRRVSPTAAEVACGPMSTPPEDRIWEVFRQETRATRWSMPGT